MAKLIPICFAIYLTAQGTQLLQKTVVYRVIPKSKHQMEILNHLWKAADPDEVWVMGSFVNYVRLWNIIYRELRFIEGRKSQRAKRSKRASRNLEDFDFEIYHSFDSARMLEYMELVHKKYPGLTRLKTLGKSHQGRPLKAIEISWPKTYLLDKRPIIWIDAGLHAREWAAPHSALYFIHALVSGYSEDSKIRQYVRNIRWVILPMANPDGYEVTQQNTIREALWRKNKSPKFCYWTTKKRCCTGVDLNRNFDAYWGGADSNKDPCSEVYRGNSSFSEPETRAIRDYVEPRRKNMAAFITMHTYSQLWGYSSSARTLKYPKDYHQLDDIAHKSVKALKRLYGTEFEVGSAADILYPASGTAMDWAKEKMKIKYTYLLELRPHKDTRRHLRAFFLKEIELLPTAKETWEGIKVVADAVLNEYR